MPRFVSRAMPRVFASANYKVLHSSMAACDALVEIDEAAFWLAIGVDRAPVANPTREPSTLPELSRAELDLVNAAHAEDFAAFGYAMR